MFKRQNIKWLPSVIPEENKTKLFVYVEKNELKHYTPSSLKWGTCIINMD